MGLLIRIALFLGIVVSLVLVIRLLLPSDRPGDHPRAAQPSGSSAELLFERDAPVVTYELVTGDALIIRFAQRGFTSCIVLVLDTPGTGRERSDPGVHADFELVPVETATSRAAEWASACGDAWIAYR